MEESCKDIIAGTLGGMVTVLVGHPLDTIKVRLQTQATSTPPLYGNSFDCVKKTMQMEGLRGFYKGMQSPMAGEGFFNAIQFLSWGWSKKAVCSISGNPNPDKLSIPQYFAAGFGTGFVSSLVESPIDFFKSQLQTQIFKPNPEYTTFFAAVKAVWKAKGVVGVYQGLGSTFLRSSPGCACYFGFYEAIKRQVEDPETGYISPMWVLGAGGVGGFMYWFWSYPFDVIKSAIQADDIHNRKYPSIVQTTKTLYQEGGWRRFTRGMGPCLLRSVPANGSCFLVYEVSKRYLDRVF